MEYCTTSYATRCPSNRCSTPKWDRSWSGYKGPRRVRGINVCRKENYSHSHSHALLPIDHSLASEHLPLSATRIQKRLLAYLNFFYSLPISPFLWECVGERKTERATWSSTIVNTKWRFKKKYSRETGQHMSVRKSKQHWFETGFISIYASLKDSLRSSKVK